MTTGSRGRGKRAAHPRGQELTTADLVVLGLLSERPMHGYELLRVYDLQEVEDWAQVSRPHVYYALRKLSASGHIVRVDGEAERRQVFSVSEAGALALANALANPAWATARVPPPFRTWLGLSIHARPEDVAAMVAARRAHLEAERERERASLAIVASFSSPRAVVGDALIRLGLAQIETELAWIDTLEVRNRSEPAC